MQDLSKDIIFAAAEQPTVRCFTGLPVPLAHYRAGQSPAADPAALTARERALCRLVHEGRTNQQIARAQHISVKTVEAYLTRVYRKTKCSSRVELAVAVTERRIQVDE